MRCRGFGFGEQVRLWRTDKILSQTFSHANHYQEHEHDGSHWPNSTTLGYQISKARCLNKTPRFIKCSIDQNHTLMQVTVYK